MMEYLQGSTVSGMHTGYSPSTIKPMAQMPSSVHPGADVVYTKQDAFEGMYGAVATRPIVSHGRPRRRVCSIMPAMPSCEMRRNEPSYTAMVVVNVAVDAMVDV